MSPATPPAPAARLTLIIDLICRIIAAAAVKKPLAAPWLLLLWPRLRRLAIRFDALAARVAAGRHPTPARPRPANARPRKPYRRLPSGNAWLVRMVQETAGAGSQLQHLLAAPEMAALLSAAPQAGRLLRPLCRMLGVPRPPSLTPPPRPARPVPPPRRTDAGHPPPTVSPRARPPRAASRRAPRACGPPVAA